jgi:hypothetical protein
LNTYKKTFLKGDIYSETASYRNRVSFYNAIGENKSKAKQADRGIIIGSLFPQSSAVFCDPKWS